MSDYADLLKPFKLKHLLLRNRVMSTAHAPHYAEDGMPGERYQLYHTEKAKGGLGLTIFGGSSSVAVDSPLSFSQIDVSHDRVLPYLRKFAGRVHEQGAALFCQITHLGRRGRWDTRYWLPLIGPSKNREPLHRAFAKEMEDFDFPRVIKAYGAAALRCRESGLDGCEVIAVAHHLIDSFLSPAVNQRTDAYGGSLENRARFGLEVLQEVRRVVGSDYVVGLRLSGDELLEGGLAAEDCVSLATLYAQSGLIDYLNVYQAHGDTFRGIATMLPNMSYPSAPFLYLASAVKAKTDLPVFHASGIRDVATANRAVAEGHVDMVAMTRGHIADPYIVRKLMEDRPDAIRQCVGAAYCIDRSSSGLDMACIQNAATGREASMPHVIAKSSASKRVVVAGGGPAGLEAARVAAARGHRVVLFEASDALGGQLKLAKLVPWREALSGIVRWLERELREARVELRLRTPATVEAVLKEEPDVVVVATGGHAAPATFEGAGHAVNSWQVLSGQAAAGSNVLVYDECGQHQGVGCADYLSHKGAAVELVTLDRMAGEDVGGPSQSTYLRRLYKQNVVMSPNLRLRSVYPEGNALIAVLKNEHSDEEEERKVDQVVCELGTLPNDELYFGLKPHSRNLGEIDLDALAEDKLRLIERNPDGRFQLFRVGDAVLGRNVHAAIYESARILKNI